MKPGKRVAIAVLVTLAAACGQTPIKPAATHIQEAPTPPGAIPPPVQIAPVLPKPEPSTRPETYSVVVSRVPAQELLFALARDARLQIDIDPTLTGLVTLNAVDQTLPQLLTRVARQIDMRYEFDGQNLVVLRDAPFLRSYKIDYLSANRNVSMRSTASTQFGAASGTAGGAGATSAGTGASSTIEVTSQNHLWESIVQNVREILRETDKVIPGTTVTPPPAPASATPPGAPPGQAPAQPQSTSTFQEAASVIANGESGLLFVRATSKQHERVQEFLDQVMSGAKRQVLIEATVAEVQLRNEYQRGIEWSKMPSTPGGSGLQLQQPAIPPTTSSTPPFNPNPFLIGFISAARNLSVSLKLLEQFGDVRVLSSPKLSVLNNQTAVLRVTRDIIYFTITPSTQPITIAAGGTGVTLQASFTTTPNVAAEGFMMTVLPQISEADAIVLNVKPTIRRQVGNARDPNPALQGLQTQNDIPLFETREFDSILRLQSGESAVLAGLMQDQVENTDTGIPGVRSIPIIGEALSQRADLTRKTELVIFLRATVVRDPSVEGDYRNFRGQLPNDEFFRKPNPQRVAPPVPPGQLDDMSLLLDALKKAEKAKEEAQRRTGGEQRERAPLRLQEEAAQAEAKPVLTRRELPDISRPLEILSDDLAPKGISGASEQRSSSGAQAPRDNTGEADRAAARKVFEVKFKEPNPRLPFFLTMGALGFAVICTAVYFWYQLPPSQPLVNTNPPPSGTVAAATPGAGPVVSPSISAPPPATPQIPGLPGSPGTSATPAVPRAPVQAPLAALPQVFPAPGPRETPIARPGISLRPGTPGNQPATREPEPAPARAAPQVHPKVESGYSAYVAGNIGGAREDYEQALRDDPGNRDALLGLAAVDVRSGRLEAAEATYLKLLRADPRDAHAQAGLIALRGARMDPLVAESRLKTLLATDPGAHVLNFTLGNQFAQQGRWAEAQQQYFKAFAADPENADFAYNLAVSLDHLRQPKLALEYYQRALALVTKRGGSFDAASARARIAQLGG